MQSSKQGVFLETWGCQMNVSDSEHMLQLLGPDFQEVRTAEEANLIILNTCHIREKARHKVVSRLGVLRSLKAQHEGLTIAVSGCVAQAEGKKLLKEARGTIDLLFGPGQISELPRLLKEHRQDSQPKIALGFKKPTSTVTEHLAQPTDIPAESLCQQTGQEKDLTPATAPLLGRSAVSRFVTIQQGCDNFCTFCVVPTTRGREVSLTQDDILRQVRQLVQGGAKEVMLLGQNVNSYGLDLHKEPQTGMTPFGSLLKAVAEVEGLLRLRFTTSNPHDLTREVAELFGAEPKLGRYMHLPVHSGSDEILEKMRRKVTRLQYLERIQWLKRACPNIALSTDLIVGFPGETEEDFQQTLSLVEEVGFSFVYAFAYSPRPGTAASRFVNSVPEDVKQERLARLNALQNNISNAQIQAEIGQHRTVLFLYKDLKSHSAYYGRTDEFRLVKVQSTEPLVGSLRQVHIREGNRTALAGDL